MLLEIEIETSEVQESDSEEKVFNDLRKLSYGGVPTVVLRTLQGDGIMAELDPIRLNNYCSKEAVKLLKTRTELDQDELQEDFMITPIIGMRIKMYVKDQTKLPAKAVLGRKWIKAYVGKICVESSRLWIRRAEHYKILTTQEDASERIENWAHQSTASSSFKEPWERPIGNQGRLGKTEPNETRAEENADQLNGETGKRVESGTQTNQDTGEDGDRQKIETEHPLGPTKFRKIQQVQIIEWDCWLCRTNEHKTIHCPEMDNWQRFSKAVREFGRQTTQRSSPKQDHQDGELDAELRDLTPERQDESIETETMDSTESGEFGWEWGSPYEPRNNKKTIQAKHENSLNIGNKRKTTETTGIMKEQVTIGLVNSRENALVLGREAPEEEITAGKIRWNYLESLETSLKELEAKMAIRVGERYKRQLKRMSETSAKSQTKVEDKGHCLPNQPVMPSGRLSDLQCSVRLQNPQVLEECSDFLTTPFQYTVNNRLFRPEGETLVGISEPEFHDKLSQSFIRALTSRQERSTPPHFLQVLSTDALSFRRNRVGFKEVDEIVALGATVIRGAGIRHNQPIFRWIVQTETTVFEAQRTPPIESLESSNLVTRLPRRIQQRTRRVNPEIQGVTAGAADLALVELDIEREIHETDMTNRDSAGNPTSAPFPRLVQCYELDDAAFEKAIAHGPEKDRMRGHINVAYLLSAVGRKDARDFFEEVRNLEDCKTVCQKNKFGKWVPSLCITLRSGRTVSLLQPFFIGHRFRILPPPSEFQNYGSNHEYEMSETWQEEVDTLYLLLRNLEICGITFPVDKIEPATPFRDDSSDSSDDDETMSTDSTGSLDREEREAVTSAFVHYAEISKFTKRAANRLGKRFNPNREIRHSKHVLPSELANEIDEPIYAPASDEDYDVEIQPVIPQTPLDHDESMQDKYASLTAESPSAKRARGQPVEYQEEELRYFPDSEDEDKRSVQEFFRVDSSMHDSDPREIVEMERLPTPPASVTLRTGKLAEKLRALVPQDPRVHSPIPVRVFNLRTTIKKPIIPELTEEERTAPQYAKRTGGPPLPSSSLSTLTYVQSKTNESDEERTVVSDEMPDLISVSDSSETSSSDESDNMEIDQLAEEDSDSSYEENNDGYSILRDKRGRVFLRDPMQQDRKWESDDEEESDEEFKSFSEAMNNSSGTKAPNPSPVEETNIPMPQFTSLESELINTILIKPVDTILSPPNSEPRPRAITACLSASARLQRNEKVLSNLGNIRYHKATDERDEFGYTDYRNYQRFVVDKEPKELNRFNSYEPAPTGHPSLAGIDVLGVGCYQYFHGPTDNHPLRKFDNTASISSIVYDRDQLDEMRDQGLIQRIVDLKRYAEDIEIDTQLYRDRAFSIATVEERLFVTFQVHAIRADYDRKDRNRFTSWGSSDARPFESIFDKSGTHLLPFDPTLNITMMHLYRTAAETYVVDMRDREAIERVNENEMLWSRKDEYLSTEKSNKVEVKCNAWTEHRWSLRRIRNETVEILQELILILEEPFNMSVILEEIKLNTTAGHYWTLHCPYIRIIDNRYSEHFQGMNRECYHLDSLANVQTQILLRKPIPTHNPFITEDEDEFLYYCAKVIDETSVNLGNTIRGLREVDMLMAEDIRVLLNSNHLDHMRFYDRFGKKYPMAWASLLNFLQTIFSLTV
ncbi:hypothetical protein C8J56DRAFT_905188 [Mycena floridula]|nr:hypothetical protein C8J56DRAFT_905188 [Mycena floridula]